MLSILLCACWPFVCLLWRNVYLDLLPIFLLDYLFVDTDEIEINGNFRAGRFVKGDKSIVNVFRRDDEKAVLGVNFNAKKAIAYTIDGTKIKLKIKKGKIELPNNKAMTILFD